MNGWRRWIWPFREPRIEAAEPLPAVTRAHPQTRVYTLTQFGPTRHDRYAPRILIPVGGSCVFCADEIIETSEGFIMVTGGITHRACLLRNLLGPDWAAITHDPPAS